MTEAEIQTVLDAARVTRELLEKLGDARRELESMAHVRLPYTVHLTLTGVFSPRGSTYDDAVIDDDVMAVIVRKKTELIAALESELAALPFPVRP